MRGNIQDHHLARVLHDWLAEAGKDPNPHAPDPETTITVEAAGDATTVTLPPGAVQRLKYVIEADIHSRRHADQVSARVHAMADIMVRAVEAGQDGGELLATALHKAAGRLYQPWYLVIGRPGSWEASIVLGMADAGGAADDEWAAPLADLLVEMGESRNQGHPQDGGDIVSQMLGEAANRLGSVPRLAGAVWAEQMENIGGQYASEEANAGALWGG